MTPNLGQIWGIIMAKLSKQDKIEIFNLWQNYQVGTTNANQNLPHLSRSNYYYTRRRTKSGIIEK